MDYSPVLAKLFSEAERKGELQYEFTLLRVAGITRIRDPLLELRSYLSTLQDPHADKASLSGYGRLLGASTDVLSLLSNLLACTRQQRYRPYPFFHLITGTFPNRVQPSPHHMAQDLASVARSVGKNKLAKIIEEAYASSVVTAALGAAESPQESIIAATFNKCHALLVALLDCYYSARLSYKDRPSLYKCRDFMVAELLTDDESGLYGIKLHFSNGEHALCVRYEDATECANFMPDDGLIPYVGDIDSLRAEWRVGDKRLYEIGLPGRYNAFGEWKPIAYPGDYAPLEKAASAASDDPDVQGALLYMMCTGHRIIEFVVKTAIDLPYDAVTFHQDFHLYKCPPQDDWPHADRNIRLYDGWIDVQQPDAEGIRMAIDRVQVGVNRLAFAYGAPASWCLKYTALAPSGVCATPSDQDTSILDSMLREFPTAEESYSLDCAVDWYNRGTASRNVFVQFLCFYIAFESLAVAIADGRADFGVGYPHEDAEDQELRKIEELRAKHDELYQSDPIGFVREARRICDTGDTSKARSVAAHIFGVGDSRYKALFSGKDSLTRLRGRLAHGNAALIDKEQVDVIRHHVGDMAHVSKEFLMRVIFAAKKGDPLPSWSAHYSKTHWGGDPRVTLVIAPDLSSIPNSDWRIRPEWCD